MSWMPIGFAIFVIIVFALIFAIPKNKSKAGDFKYQKIAALFTPAERAFLGVLKLTVDDKAEIYGKVRVADVIKPIKGQARGDWQRAFNKVSAKHFDFLLCRKEDQTPICAIELNDSSHNSKKRQERDNFLEDACLSADFPLVQIKARSSYKVAEIRDALSDYLPNVKSTQAIETEDAKSASESTTRLCPKCSSEMTVKVAKKGKNIGNQFWACSSFPNCRHIESIES